MPNFLALPRINLGVKKADSKMTSEVSSSTEEALLPIIPAKAIGPFASVIKRQSFDKTIFWSSSNFIFSLFLANRTLMSPEILFLSKACIG